MKQKIKDFSHQKSNRIFLCLDLKLTDEGRDICKHQTVKVLIICFFMKLKILLITDHTLTVYLQEVFLDEASSWKHVRHFKSTTQNWIHEGKCVY